MSRSITVNHNGKKYTGHVATIETTKLYRHEHYGIFTADLGLNWDEGSWVTFGGYTLDDKPVDRERRKGTAYGMDHIIEIIDTVGVSSWEALKGKQVIALFDYTESGITWGRSIHGIAHLTDEKKVFIPAEHAEAWK